MTREPILGTLLLNEQLLALYIAGLCVIDIGLMPVDGRLFRMSLRF